MIAHQLLHNCRELVCSVGHGHVEHTLRKRWTCVSKGRVQRGPLSACSLCSVQPLLSPNELCLCADAHHFCKQLSVPGKTDSSSGNKLHGLTVLSLPLAEFGSEAGTQLSSGQ